MSIYSKPFSSIRRSLLGKCQIFFKDKQGFKGPLFDCLKNSVFHWPGFLALLFLLLLLSAGFFLPSYLDLATLTNKEDIDNLFLGQIPEGRFIALPLNFINQDSLKAVTVSYIPSAQVLGMLAGDLSGLQEPKNKILEYIVQSGDTFSSIAEKFGISLETLLRANDLSSSSVIQPGQKLIILPVSGILHYVKKGETLSEIVRSYRGNIEEVLAFNELSDGEKIFVGDLLIIPGGKMPARRIATRTPSLPLPDTLFICPISSPCRITQGLHWYNAIDFSNGECSEPVFAVARGTIQKTGLHTIAGKYIRVLHPSGIVTFYGHLSKILVTAGQDVSQGQIIGYTGHTGYTIPAGPAGCHLHFEVRGARNPFAE